MTAAIYCQQCNVGKNQMIMMGEPVPFLYLLHPSYTDLIRPITNYPSVHHPRPAEF